jgi:hypothetical protein
MAARFRRVYGASPLHLLTLLASLAIAGAAVAGWSDSFRAPTMVKVLAWFFGAIVAHDLVLMPLYSLLDRIAFGPRSARRAPLRADRALRVNYVRIPVLLSGLLLLVFFPEIFRLGDHTFFVASGFHQRVFLVRYLLTSGSLFALSALAYAISVKRATNSAIPGSNSSTGR